MWKRLVVVAAVLAVGCGTSSEDGDGAGAPPGSVTEVGGFALPRLAAGTQVAKVIARRIDAVTVTVPVTDENGDPVIVGGVPQTVTSTTQTEVFRYVTNVVAPATTVMIPDGTHYTIDVIGGAPVATVGTGPAAHSARTVLEHWRVQDVTVGPGSSLTFSPVAAPATTISPIYVGLAAPYDRFTVTAGFAFPWSTWTLTCGTLTSTVAGSRATVNAPTVNGPVDCEARFSLPMVLNVPGEANTWELPESLSATPAPSTVVTLP